MFCHQMVQFYELRLAELEIYSEKMDDTVKLVEYLYAQRISCEKLTILFPQDLEYLPDELTEFLRPLKLVILPTKYMFEDEILQSYYHLADNVEHISLFEVQKNDVPRTLFERNILAKKSICIHYVHNFIQEDDPSEYNGLYGDLLAFYKNFISSSYTKMKDFQFYFQNYRDHEFDPVLDIQEPNELLRYIAGDRQPQEAQAVQRKQCQVYSRGPSTVYIEDPSNPEGLSLEAGFSHILEYGFYDRRASRRGYYNLKNQKKSLLVKTWLLPTEEFHLNRLVVSITEGRKLKEYIMTLFADSSEKMRVYFAIAVLTDWDSYRRFLGLMDTKNYKFRMEEIEEDVKKIICS